MLRIHVPGAVVAILAAALAAPAAYGQQATPSPAPAPAPPTAGGGTAVAPIEAGGLQRTQGGWRSSQIVGATVYNDRDARIGSVDDLIVGQDGKISEAVLSVGGFLGIGAKLVAVPYDQLRFEERTESRTAVGVPAAAPVAPGVPAAALPARPVAVTRVVLPGATRDSLNAQPEFRYRDRG